MGIMEEQSVWVQTDADQPTRRQLSLIKGVAMELKNPLTHLAGTSHMLASGQYRPEELVEQLLRLELASDRLIKLVDGLLLAGRAADGQIALDLEPINVAAIVSRGVKELEPLAQRYGRSFRVQFTAELMPAVAHDRALDLVCYNLLDTIMRTSHSEVVEVLVHHQLDGVMVTIRDDGDTLETATLTSILRKLGTSAQPSQHLPGVSGVSLFIANTLLTGMSGHLQAGRVRNKRTLSLTLPRSHQLQLVSI